MRKPHVYSLFYKVSSGENISYRDPEPLSFTNSFGIFDLRDGILRITFNSHFPDEEKARNFVEPFLRSWEMETDLKSNIGMIRFNFERAKLIDLDPPLPGEPQNIKLKTVISAASVTSEVTVHLACDKYPEPPKIFCTTPDAELGYQRWINYREGKESLQSMAYFILTLMESNYGGRKNAATTFKIDNDILKTIGKLSSTKGNKNTARKAAKTAQFQELSNLEKHWLEKAIRCVIIRLGERTSGAQLSLIAMNDLPKI